MRFFDFLQDVTGVGVVLALSTFLLNNESRDESAFVSTQQVAKPTIGIDSLVDAEFDTFGFDTSDDDVVLGESSTSPATPLPIDLDALEKSFDAMFGLAKTKDVADDDSFLPEDFVPVDIPAVERRIDLAPPAPASKPLVGVDRPFDDTDLFDDAVTFGGNDVVGSVMPPPPTRRLGPVENLTPPSF